MRQKAMSSVDSVKHKEKIQAPKENSKNSREREGSLIKRRFN